MSLSLPELVMKILLQINGRKEASKSSKKIDKEIRLEHLESFFCVFVILFTFDKKSVLSFCVDLLIENIGFN